MAAVLIDRDGTMNDQGGYCHPNEFEVAPWAVEAITLLNAHGLKTALVTNQSGIFHGWFTSEELHRSFERLIDSLTSAGAHLDAIYYCPHGPTDGCENKKPSSGMLKRAANDLNISPDNCFMVGDTGNDIVAGHGASCRTLLVQTGWGIGSLGNPNYRQSWAHVEADWIVADLLEAAEVISREVEPIKAHRPKQTPVLAL